MKDRQEADACVSHTCDDHMCERALKKDVWTQEPDVKCEKRAVCSSS